MVLFDSDKLIIIMSLICVVDSLEDNHETRDFVFTRSRQLNYEIRERERSCSLCIHSITSFYPCISKSKQNFNAADKLLENGAAVSLLW